MSTWLNFSNLIHVALEIRNQRGIGEPLASGIKSNEYLKAKDAGYEK